MQGPEAEQLLPGKVRPDPRAGGWAGGWAAGKMWVAMTFQLWDRAQGVVARQGQAVGADAVGGKLRGLSPSLGWHRQMPGPSRENKGTEFMRHTEAKMDISQNTTPSELNHRGKPFVILSSWG